MKQNDLIKHIRKHGCVFIREGSSHSVWYNPLTGRTSTIPRHSEINTYTGKKICNDLGVVIINKK
ncbi:addiction module toxin, HicA family [Candidatus Nomurabacteria bacterium RIFCSPHIGHO2_02_FULL_33_12]|uniref:Addiction module toxin, HicA family n=1 Tax=Candidatus Nomurabacteria bacterium RIFCSPLOWO2_01_FULL_33_17 TaxID=1801764 RepID=A0A1F6WNP4_9BACT|nr:MAG: addiction module toxin, HicA family [Candidatus Nomurabacteria bacterium RIFCSPHIGHO2_02_FULL_33_12]OGI83511.1 MAG: addiction module toxin, HicA family [Candidatus Nomurabacteria bacterium RIFCSPLOWO2_01_FULL_33_17]